jgi:hypothetical protein
VLFTLLKREKDGIAEQLAAAEKRIAQLDGEVRGARR